VPPRYAAAQAALSAARDGSKAAQRAVDACDRAVRDLDRALAGVQAQRAGLAARLDDIDARLAGAPTPQRLRDDLAAINELQLQADEAALAVRGAREDA